MRAGALGRLHDDPSYQRLQPHQGERARTVWVSLLDDAGQPLPEDQAQQTLTQARAQAGPRDMVVGVRRPVE